MEWSLLSNQITSSISTEPRKQESKVVAKVHLESLLSNVESCYTMDTLSILANS